MKPVPGMPILTSLLFLIMLINCDDDAGSSPLTSFDGEWIIEQATLDRSIPVYNSVVCI